MTESFARNGISEWQLIKQIRAALLFFGYRKFGLKDKVPPPTAVESSCREMGNSKGLTNKKESQVGSVKNCTTEGSKTNMPKYSKNYLFIYVPTFSERFVIQGDF